MRRSTSNSTLITDFKKLALRPEIEQLASQLLSESEVPVSIAYEENPRKRNVFAKHPMNQNQFMIFIRPQVEEREFERLLLSGLYFAVQTSDRYLSPIIIDQSTISDSLKHSLYEALSEIDSFSKSLDAEKFLAKFNIRTSDQVLNCKMKKISDILNTYTLEFNSQGKQWNKYEEIFYIVQIVSLIRKGEKYSKKLRKQLNQILPSSISQRYLCKIDEILRDIQELEQLYDHVLTGDSFANKVSQTLIERLDLQEVVSLGADNAFFKDISISGQKVVLYSFVPTDWEKRTLYLSGFRFMNECISIYRQLKGLSSSLPTIKVTISRDQFFNSYSYGNEENGYAILISTSFLDKAFELSEECYSNAQELPPGFALLEDVHQRIFKYVLFIVTLHELGHIENGDCDKVFGISEDNNRWEHEAKADLYAKEHLQCFLHFQHRPENYYEFMSESILDCALSKYAISIANKLREPWVISSM